MEKTAPFEVLIDGGMAASISYVSTSLAPDCPVRKHMS
jgi:hypothetical protein